MVYRRREPEGLSLNNMCSQNSPQNKSINFVSLKQIFHPDEYMINRLKM